MREFAFANVPSSWLGRGGSRLGSRLRVTISFSAVGELAELAELANGRYTEVGGFKSEFLFLSNVQGEKVRIRSANYLG